MFLLAAASALTSCSDIRELISDGSHGSVVYKYVD